MVNRARAAGSLGAKERRSGDQRVRIEATSFYVQFSIQGLSNLQEGEVPCKGPVTEASGGAREQHGGHGERGQKGKHQAGNVAGAT